MQAASGRSSRPVEERPPFLSHVQLNRELAAAATSNELFALLERYGLDALNDVNCATSLSKVARLVRSSPPPPAGAVALLLARTAAVLDSCRACNGRTLTSIAHSAGALKSCESVLPALCAAVVRLPTDAATPGALATLLGTMGTVGPAAVGSMCTSVCTAAAAAAGRMTVRAEAAVPRPRRLARAAQ